VALAGVFQVRDGHGQSSDLFRRLEQLNAIGAALSKERDINRLLETILIAAKTITHADGGTLYRMTEDGKALRFEILRTDSLDIAMGGTTGNVINFPESAALQQRQGGSQRLDGRRLCRHPRQDGQYRRRLHGGRLRLFRHPQLRRAHRISLAVLPHGADEEPRGRDHRRAATDQRHGSTFPQGHGPSPRPTRAWPNRWPRRRPSR
jgi:hypothetical protein